MTTLKINREFFVRHLAVGLLMLGMSGWFAYDGAVTYPATPAADLYESIEKSPPAEGYDVESFKVQKIRRQFEFAALAFAAAAVILLHLAAVAAFRFSYDGESFVWKGVRRKLDEIKSVDRTAWKKKGILKLVLEKESVKLDSWHHNGVIEFEKMI